MVTHLNYRDNLRFQDKYILEFRFLLMKNFLYFKRNTLPRPQWADFTKPTVLQKIHIFRNLGMVVTAKVEDRFKINQVKDQFRQVS